jgi:hypothetical protein
MVDSDIDIGRMVTGSGIDEEDDFRHVQARGRFKMDINCRKQVK